MSIYGTSTQALYHANLFASHYPDIAINIIARSEASKQRFAQKMLEHGISSTSITIGGEVAADPDIIVTATSSPTPVVSTENVQSTKLIIAVGSSSGSRSEISEDVVISRDLYVDASVSIDGKGEYRIPLDSNLISGGAIKELHQLLRAEKNHVFRTPALFVSKGLVIEDYAVARRVYEYFKEMNADV
jgi:ornithine cyclodeaminase/alanine dehydrogenase-like protein (mu-crystallin family)